MYFEDFQTRTINILNALDTTYFGDAVAAIKKVVRADTSGFADISAKALILFMALDAVLANRYYHQLEDKRKLFLARSIHEDLDKQIKNIHQKKADHIRDAAKKLRELNQFLAQQNHLATVYANRPKNKEFISYLSYELLNQILQPNESMDRDSAKLIEGYDVDVDDYECFYLEQSTSLVGTSALLCCVAVCMYGTAVNGRSVLCIGHFSLVEEEDIQGMVADYDIILGTEEIYLIGGSVASITDLTNLLLNTELAIHDMRVCICNGLVESPSIVIINPAQPEELHYVHLKTQPVEIKKRKISEKEIGSAAECFKRQQMSFFNPEEGVVNNSVVITPVVPAPRRLG
jgi:hypothetical protein